MSLAVATIAVAATGPAEPADMQPQALAARASFLRIAPDVGTFDRVSFSGGAPDSAQARVRVVRHPDYAGGMGWRIEAATSEEAASPRRFSFYFTPAQEALGAAVLIRYRLHPRRGRFSVSQRPRQWDADNTYLSGWSLARIVRPGEATVIEQQIRIFPNATRADLYLGLKSAEPYCVDLEGISMVLATTPSVALRPAADLIVAGTRCLRVACIFAPALWQDRQPPRSVRLQLRSAAREVLAEKTVPVPDTADKEAGATVPTRRETVLDLPENIPPGEAYLSAELPDAGAQTGFSDRVTLRIFPDFMRCGGNDHGRN